MKNFLLWLFLLYSPIYSQDSEYSFPDFSIKLQEGKLVAVDLNKKLLFEKIFNHPSGFTADLDEDGLEEFLITDSIIVGNKINFILYIFNTLDSFGMVDSIVSGAFEPYNMVSQETGIAIIITGNSAFDIFNEDAESYFLPINCWRYESSQLFLINDELYDIFIEENEGIINFIEDNFDEQNKDCLSNLDIKPAIAAAYANYINAGEESVASQFLKKYYLCSDIEDFKNQLRALTTGNTNEN